MIGTFQAETDEEVAYGLVHPLASWDPVWTQVKNINNTIKCRANMIQVQKKNGNECNDCFSLWFQHRYINVISQLLE